MKSKAETIYNMACQRGIFLSYLNDQQILVGPREACDAGFERLLLENKSSLIKFLKWKDAGWLNTCRQIADGEFDLADASTIRRLLDGLTDVPGEHPVRRRARERLLKFQNTTNK